MIGTYSIPDEEFRKKAERAYVAAFLTPVNIRNAHALLGCCTRLPLTLLEAEKYNVTRWRSKRHTRRQYKKKGIPLLASGVSLKSSKEQKAEYAEMEAKGALEEYLKKASAIDLAQKRELLRIHRKKLISRYYTNALKWHYFQ